MLKCRTLFFLIPLLLLGGIVYLFSDWILIDKTEFPPLETFRDLTYQEQRSIITSAAEKDPIRTWEYLKSTLLVSGQQISNAHEFGHIVGNAIYSEYGFKGIKNCDPSFSFSCYHGVTEKLLQEKGVFEIGEIQKECIDILPSARDHTNCIHGAGHGLYLSVGEDLRQALVECDRFDDQYRRFCYDGVFMENASASPSSSFDPKDPWKFCTDLDEKYHRNCARYQAQVFLTSAGSVDSEKAGPICLNGPTALLRETCFESLGFYIAQEFRGDPDSVWAACSKMTGEGAAALCTISAAAETVFQRYLDYQKSANQLCGRLNGPNKSECLNGVNNMLKN